MFNQINIKINDEDSGMVSLLLPQIITFPLITNLSFRCTPVLGLFHISSFCLHRGVSRKDSPPGKINRIPYKKDITA